MEMSVPMCRLPVRSFPTWRLCLATCLLRLPVALWWPSGGPLGFLPPGGSVGEEGGAVRKLGNMMQAGRAGEEGIRWAWG